MDSPRGIVVGREDRLRHASARPHGVPRHERRRHRRHGGRHREGARLRPRLPRRRPHDEQHRRSAPTAGSTSPSATTASSRRSARTARPISHHGGARRARAPRRHRPRDRHRRHAQHLRRRHRSVRPRVHRATTRTTATAGTRASLRRRRRANMGYPSLFRTSATEHFPLARRLRRRLGGRLALARGSGLAGRLNNTLFTGDWTTQRIYKHALTPKGSIYGVTQDEFISLLRPSDLALDGELEPLRREPRGRTVHLQHRHRRLRRAGARAHDDAVARGLGVQGDRRGARSSSSRRGTPCTGCTPSRSCCVAARSRPSSRRSAGRSRTSRGRRSTRRGDLHAQAVAGTACERRARARRRLGRRARARDGAPCARRSRSISCRASRRRSS